MKKTLALLAFSCLLFVQAISAQTSLDTPLPQDANTVVGKLPIIYATTKSLKSVQASILSKMLGHYWKMTIKMV